MLVLACLTLAHDPWFVATAALMCIVGAVAAIGLQRRSLAEEGLPRAGWLFLTAVTAGSSIWATHFIAMLGYESSVSATIAPMLTILSILVAILGTGIAFTVVALAPRITAVVAGGGVLGLSIAAMHFTGMFGYRVEGIVRWDATYVALAIVLACAFSIAAMSLVRSRRVLTGHVLPAGLLVVAIVSLHFTGMTAFQVEAISVTGTGLEQEALHAMALAVLVAALVVVGTGVSSYLIDDRKQAISTARLHRMAFHDPLTGLANRRALGERLEERFAGGRPLQLLLVDLDGFKRVNDNYGHGVGDEILVQACRRIEGLLDGTSFAARIGGDEIAVVVDGGSDLGADMAASVVASVAQPFHVAGNRLTVGASVGYCGTEGLLSVQDLMHRADIALYEAKRRGRGRATRYLDGMLEASVAHNRIEADLTDAIVAGQFHLAYQPLVDLSSGRTMGMEALLRWNHPTRGAVSPAEFVPVAEASGQIVEIGAWVLREACREAAGWQDGTCVSVNVSAVQLRSPDFVGTVRSALADTGLPAHRLEIELTETAMVTSGDDVVRALEELRAEGVAVAMDDFGTGYSSLAHLRILPIDRIKIDRSFVAGAETDPSSMAVLKAITTLGRSLAIPTLAEGVETQAQADLLRELGCEAVQGYLFGRPERPKVALPAAA